MLTAYLKYMMGKEISRKMSSQMFAQKESLLSFIQNSLVQFIRLKFRDKHVFLSNVEEKSGIKVSSNLSYLEVLYLLEKRGYSDPLKEFFGISSPIEACHLYLFYRLLNDLLYETTWIKRFSPFYNFVFGGEIKIRDKKELRHYVAEIVTNFDEKTLCEKWIEFSSRHQYPPVIHLGHFITGPCGFILTPYYREKPILDFPKPVLDTIVEYTQTGKEIVDWNEIDIVKFFSHIINGIANGLENTCTNYPAYKDYLKWIGFDFSPAEWKRELPELTENLRDHFKKEQIPLWFYILEQLTGMFLKDEDIIKLLNMLIAEDILVIKNETEVYDIVCIHKDSIILKPKSWIARPAIDLAKDLETIMRKEKEFWQILREILEKGAVKYLEQVYDHYPMHFRNLLLKKRLFKLVNLDSHIIPREVIIKRILEGYGFQIPAITSLDIREDLKEYFMELLEFKNNYQTFDEKSLLRKMIYLLRDGRYYAERIFKEISFILSALELHYKEISNYQIETPFITEWPLFLPSPYNKERDVTNIKNSIFNLWNEIAQEELKRKIQEEKKFTLGDWYAVSSKLLRKLRSNTLFLNTLPEDARKRIEDAKKILRDFDKVFVWLNKASHESGVREIKENIDSREKALYSVLNLDTMLKNLFSLIPPLIEVTNEVSEVKTGLKLYEAKAFKENFIEENVRIYGILSIDLSHTYYLIFQRLEEKDGSIAIYPLLITNIVDAVLGNL